MNTWKLVVVMGDRNIYENNGSLMSIKNRSAVAVDINTCNEAQSKVPNFEDKKQSVKYIDENQLWDKGII